MNMFHTCTGPASLTCDLDSCTEPSIYWASVLNLMFWCHHLEILNNIIFGIVFCKQSLTWSFSITWAEEMYTVCMSSFLDALFAYPMSMRFWWIHNASWDHWDSKLTQGKPVIVAYLYSESCWTAVHQGPWGFCAHFISSCDWVS